MHKWIAIRIALTAAGCVFLAFWYLHKDVRTGPQHGQNSLQSAASARQQAIKAALALESERRQADETIWAAELLAEQHEDVFVGLWDALRKAPDPLEVLGRFEFGELVLGELGPGTNLTHGIQWRSVHSPGHSCTPGKWREILRRFKQEGFGLVESEWRHARFDPSTNGYPHSTIAITLHVTNQQERLVMRGDLKVDWRKDGAPFPEMIDATGLEMLRQAGEPAFEKVLAQEIRPELHPVFIDPLIVYDLNGDGLAEIILVGQNLVLWNRGHGEFQAGRLCEHPITSINAAVLAEFTGDGLPDLLGADQDGLILFVGEPGGVFTAAARRSPLQGGALPNAFVLTAGDVNGDGALDVWLGQYKLPYVTGQMPTPYYDANDGFPSFLLLNDGHGNFRDATAESGLAQKRFRRTYSASLVDLDGDGDLDLLVVSDFAGVDLYLNDGHGRFTDVTRNALDEPHAFGMAHTLGDYNGDGRLDFLVVGMNSYTGQRLDQLGIGPPDRTPEQPMRAKMAYGNRLYFGGAAGWSQDSLSAQVARTGWSWGVTSFDYDNDGSLDLYIVNGHKSRASARDYEAQFWRHDIYVGTSKSDPALDIYFQSVADRLYGAGWSYGGYEHNRLFMNQHGRAFLEIGFPAGVAMAEDCRDVVSEDLDNDGKVDLVITTLEVWPRDKQALHLFRNRVADAGNWIGFHLRESRPGYSPVGARISISTRGNRQFRQLVTGDSYRSQHANTAHFGLGTDTRVDWAEIRWPNGKVQRLEDPAINQYHAIQASPIP